MPNLIFVSALFLSSDRQKCAVWIKKLCEPPSSGITGRYVIAGWALLGLPLGARLDPFAIFRATTISC